MTQNDIDYSTYRMFQAVYSQLGNMGVDFGKTVIAGGAVRDALLGKPEAITDIDVFTYGENKPLTGFPISCLRVIEAADYYGHGLLKATSILDLELPGVGKPVQLINLALPFTNVEFLLQRFDINICQAAITNTGVVITTAEFTGGVRNKTIEVLPWNETTATDGHLWRVKTKYPDFSVVDGRIAEAFDIPF